MVAASQVGVVADLVVVVVGGRGSDDDEAEAAATMDNSGAASGRDGVVDGGDVPAVKRPSQGGREVCGVLRSKAM